MSKITSLCLYTIFTFMIVSCINIEEGKDGCSDSIKESKEKKVFVSSKSLLKDSDSTNKNLFIVFNEIWVEKMWFQGKHKDEAIAKNNLYRLVLNINKIIPENVSDSLAIIYNNDTMKMAGVLKNTILLNELEQKDLTDTIKLDFYTTKDIHTGNLKRKLKTIYLY